MPGDNPTALVLLASEQLWPNIHSIEYWGKTLKRVLIYHTDNVTKSEEPARRLVKFCKTRYDLDATLIPGTNSPEDLVNKLAPWVKQETGESWVINATGGTKPMYDGAASFRGRGVRVVYREFGGQNLWYELGRTDGGVPTTKRISVPAELTDAIPIKLLLQTLWETDQLKLSFSPAPNRLPFPDIARALIEDEGDWRKAFARVGAPLGGKESGGVPFERYVAAGLIEMGVSNLTHSVKQKGSDSDGKRGSAESTQEIDIVANHRSRLLVFDCKLTAEEADGREAEGITSQLRQAAQTARHLGGIGGEVVLLRPNREITGAILDLAHDLRVRVIDKNDRGCFFHKLAEFVGCGKLPDSLRQTDELFTNPTNALLAFPPMTGVRRLARAVRRGPVIDLEPLGGDWARELGQDWTVVRIRGDLHYLQYANRRGLSRAAFDTAIRTAWEGFAKDLQVDIANSGNTLYALFAVPPENEPALREFLASRVGKPLIE